jgi:integrase
VTKGVKYPVEILERREVEALLAGCGSSRTGRRDRAVLTLLWRSGLRISEALALRPADVNLSAGTVRVLRGKGGKARTVALDALARSALEAWLAVRPAGRGPLFCPVSKPGQPLKSNHIRNRLRRLAARTGVEKRVHPHGLRAHLRGRAGRRGLSGPRHPRPARTRERQHDRCLPARARRLDGRRTGKAPCVGGGGGLTRLFSCASRPARGSHRDARLGAV